jgi:hypothetical protein
MSRKLILLGMVVLAFCGSHLLQATVSAEDNEVDLLLVLAADTSRSVNYHKFRLQREGFAFAVSDPRVIRTMMAGPRGRIAICFLEWAGETEQNVAVDWVLIARESDARDLGERILAAPRAYRGRTSISAAIDYSMRQLDRSPFQAPRRVINVSGDGTNNSGRPVAQARDEAAAKNVTINGIAILSEVPHATDPLHTHIRPAGLRLTIGTM